MWAAAMLWTAAMLYEEDCPSEFSFSSPGSYIPSYTWISVKDHWIYMIVDKMIQVFKECFNL